MSWSHAGKVYTFNPADEWFAATPFDLWSNMDLEDKKLVVDKFLQYEVSLFSSSPSSSLWKCFLDELNCFPFWFEVW